MGLPLPALVLLLGCGELQVRAGKIHMHWVAVSQPSHLTYRSCNMALGAD
jgi:hypothetical protein